VHPRELARLGVVFSVGLAIFAVAAYVVLNSLGAFQAGLWGSLFGLGLFAAGLAGLVVAVLFFLGGGADVLSAWRGRKP